jgi:glycosyltransferase involved in cell wall biosynthesis
MKIMIVGNTMWSMVRFRGSLIATLIGRGHRIVAMCPPGSDEELAALKQLGASWEPCRSLDRAGLNPLAETRLLADLVRAMRRQRPDAVFAYFLKAALWGTLAARLAGVRHRVALIEGLGFAFTEGGDGGAIERKRRTARRMVAMLMRLALRHASKVLVLNPADRDFIVGSGFARADRVADIDGIGIDLAEFNAEPPAAGPPTFLLVARMLREKGIVEFIEAARIVRRDHPEARFLLVGGADANPNSISDEDLRAWLADGAAEWLGPVADVRPLLRQCSVFVLPSWREGRSRTIMEAMAMSRPVITCRVPGCGDALTDGESGIVVPAKSAGALARACLRFVEDPTLCTRMGHAARREAERRYDVRRSNLRQVAAIEDDRVEATAETGTARARALESADA